MANSINYEHSGNTVRVLNFNDEFLKKEIDPAVYTVMHSDTIGFYLQKENDQFKIPKKLYGHVNNNIDRILNTYDNRDSDLGIILTGDKGSGKSMLSQLIGNEFVKRKLPVILVQSPFYGEDFNNFISNLGDALVIFDEFAKTYSNGDGNLQDKLLTLFDGASSSTSVGKKLFIVLENNYWELSKFISDRPGRFYYHFQYDKIDQEAIEDYVKDKDIKDKRFVNDLINYSKKVNTFTFDILKAIVEEKIRYNENLSDIVNFLNIPEVKSYEDVKIIKIIRKSDNHEFELISDTTLNGTHFNFYKYLKDIQEISDDEKRKMSIDPYDDIQMEDGNITYFDNTHYIVITKTEDIPEIDYSKFYQGGSF